jgi:hypothetical protein
MSFLGSQESNTNGVTHIDIVDSPAAGKFKVVTDIAIFNAATAKFVVTISKFDGSDDYVFFREDLLAGEVAEWSGRQNIDETRKIRIVLDGPPSTEFDVTANFALEES